MISKLQNIELTAIHSSGRCVGKFDTKNIFTDFGIPGELVSIKKDRKQRGFYYGFIHEIIEASEFRVSPFCMHFGLCGGCNWQHIDYAKQLELKRLILVQALDKYQIVYDFIPVVIPSPQKQFFRNKTEFAFSAITLTGRNTENGKYQTNHNNVVGFHPLEKSHLVFPISECFIQSSMAVTIVNWITTFCKEQEISFFNPDTHEGIMHHCMLRNSTENKFMCIIGMNNPDNETVTKLITAIRNKFPEISSLYFLQEYNANTFLNPEAIIHVEGTEKYIYEKMDDFKFRISPSTFFQPNSLQAIKIYQKIKEYANLNGSEWVLDLYTGAGTIACYISKNAKRITGIEGSVQSIVDAIYNAEQNNCSNVDFITGDILTTFNSEWLTKNGKPDVIILDPPRSGTLIEIKKTILLANPSKIIYVSCNPVSLAFDLKQLCENYKVKLIQPFDMFPHTHHLETVVLLERI